MKVIPLNGPRMKQIERHAPLLNRIHRAELLADARRYRNLILSQARGLLDQLREGPFWRDPEELALVRDLDRLVNNLDGRGATYEAGPRRAASQTHQQEVA